MLQVQRSKSSIRAQANSIASTDVSLAGSQFAILRPPEAEFLQGRTVRPRHPGRLIFKQRLIRSHFPRLRGARIALELLEGLPAEPAEFVVVPHIDERPSGPRVLQVGIVQASFIYGA